MKNKCVNCFVRLIGGMSRTASDLDTSARFILSAWTNKLVMTDLSKLCLQCYGLIQGLNMEVGIPPQRIFGHTNICYSCGFSMLRSRKPSHSILECHNSNVRDIFLERIPTYQEPFFTHVCNNCWRSVRRQIQRVSSITQEIAGPSIGDILPETKDDIELMHENSPEPHQETVSVIPAPPLPEESKVTSRNYKRVAATSRRCLFSGCPSMERLLVPHVIRERLLGDYKLYIPLSARICGFHLDTHNWERLVQLTELRDFTGCQMDNMLSIMEKYSKSS